MDSKRFEDYSRGDRLLWVGDRGWAIVECICISEVEVSSFYLCKIISSTIEGVVPGALLHVSKSEVHPLPFVTVNVANLRATIIGMSVKKARRLLQSFNFGINIKIYNGETVDFLRSNLNNIDVEIADDRVCRVLKLQDLKR